MPHWTHQTEKRPGMGRADLPSGLRTLAGAAFVLGKDENMLRCFGPRSLHSIFEPKSGGWGNGGAVEGETQGEAGSPLVSESGVTSDMSTRKSRYCWACMRSPGKSLSTEANCSILFFTDARTCRKRHERCQCFQWNSSLRYQSIFQVQPSLPELL